MKIRGFKTWNWRSIHRPIFYAERWGDKRLSVWVDWGNGTCDPVWTLGFEISFGKGDTTE